MERLLWVCLGGAIGTGVRYGVGLWAAERLGPAFPWGTLFVNVSGCFFMAVVMELALRVPTFPPDVRFAVATGFLGGLTTFSTFNYETTKLIEDGARGTALLNVGATVLACFGAGAFGLALVRRALSE